MKRYSHFTISILALAITTLACGRDVSTPDTDPGFFTPRDQLVFSPETLPEAQVGIQYKVEIQISKNVTPVFDFDISEGTLPKGLTFEFLQNEQKANIHGIPEETGTFQFKLFAACYGTSVSGQSGVKAYTIVVK